ncbi:MAG TPA: alpha-glucosidase [Acidobacteriaceae bacterium]|nr:alpha-glucosidase [Acidobacteriaceae bacterium]
MLTKLTRVLLLLSATLLVPTAHAQAPPTPAQLAAAATPTTDATWWKHAVIYEIYPRSFQDTNGDGIGDLNGITQRLDYLQHLGVDAIWIAPMYPSPQVDFGYDIANYETVDPQYGTLADFDRLVAEAKKRNIRVLLDMVLNHTSDKHPWFTDSASSRTNPHADWYIWNDGKPTSDPKAPNAHHGPHGWVVPPNNWSSLFQGSAWEWVPARGQFYYHFFYKQQPDLNWRNPAVEKAMFDAMRFWLDRGVSGFRLDAITTLYEDPTLHDEPLTGKLDASGFPESNHTLTSGLPEVNDVLRRLRTMIDSYPGNRVLVGEIYVPATSDLLQWYGTPSHPELHLPMDTLVGFHEEGNGITGAKNVALNLPHFRETITEMETELGGHQPLIVFDNHDNTRSWDRFGDGVHNADIARIIATMLLTTRSAALMYYGEELGMTTQVPTRREDVRDPIGITGWPKEKGRDGERTPMQWSPDAQAGFSTDPHTWLPVEPAYTTVNAATETADHDSLLNWYRTLIAIRRDNPTMHDGGIVMLDTTNPSVLSYVRTGPHPLVVSLNMTSQPQTVHLDLSAAGIKSGPVKTLLADAASLTSLTTVSDFTLPPYASLIAEVQ